MHQKELVDAFDENKKRGQTNRDGQRRQRWRQCGLLGVRARRRPPCDGCGRGQRRRGQRRTLAPSLFPAAAAAGRHHPCCLRRRCRRGCSPGRPRRPAAALTAGAAPAWLSRRCDREPRSCKGWTRPATRLPFRRRRRRRRRGSDREQRRGEGWTRLATGHPPPRRRLRRRRRGSVAPSAAAPVQRETEQPGLGAAWTWRRRVNAAWTRRHLNQRHLDWPGLDSAPPETSPPGLGAARVNAAWTLPYLDSAPPETTPLRQRLDSTPPGFGTRDSALLGLGAGRLPVNFDFAAALSRLCLDSDLVTPESTPLRLGAAWTRHRLSLRCRASAQR